MLKIADQPIDQRPFSETIVPQKQIETELEKVVNLGSIDCMYLFSSEGLLLAGVSGGNDFSQDAAGEVAYTVTDALDFLGNDTAFKGGLEILMVGRTRRSVAVRTFRAFGQEVTLVLVVPRGKRYRANTNRLVKTIKEISQTVMD
jgi:hypothetical protein